MVVKILLCGPGAAHNCTHGRWQRLVHLITINFSSVSYKPHLTSVSPPPVVLCGSSRRFTSCTSGVLYRERSPWTATDGEHKVVAESHNFTVGSPITHRGCQPQSKRKFSDFTFKRVPSKLKTRKFLIWVKYYAYMSLCPERAGPSPAELRPY